MNQSAIIAALAAFGGALFALVVYHVAVVRPRFARFEQLLALHDELLGGGGDGAVRRVASLEEAAAGLARQGERVDERVRELESLSRVDVSRIGFIRYDAFDDAGSALSYALALLNREGNGVVLSSIYARNDTRTFGKGVQNFEPVVRASDEELRAIAQARGSAS